MTLGEAAEGSRAARPQESPQIKAYSQPLELGRCRKTSGTTGKYDSVRRLWEDQVTGLFLRPHLSDLVEENRRRGRGLRILDLGCGSGDGLDLIRAIPRERCSGSDAHQPALVTDELLDKYVGVDINDDLLGQALEHHAEDRRVSFVRADLSEGLPAEILSDHEPFDLYFSSYAMLSHFHDESCTRILADVCGHARGHALFVGDWLGQYSYEWQDLWREPAEPDQFIEYRMSYLYEPAQRVGLDIPVFPLRLMTREAILGIVQRASRDTGARLRPLTIFDRSILTGRHTDTREYNSNCPRLRGAVNFLFERDARTDLERLLVKYEPREGFGRLNRFFEGMFAASNRLVMCTLEALRGGDSSGWALESMARPGSRGLRQSIQALRTAIEEADRFDRGDVRANLIEPLLGYALRRLEMDLQQGIGAGHSIGAVIDIRNEGESERRLEGRRSQGIA